MGIQGQFNDKVVLVTGAAGGIGESAAQAFAVEGAKVVFFTMNGDLCYELVSVLGHSIETCGVSAFIKFAFLYA